jgi:hypothetical protein
MSAACAQDTVVNIAAASTNLRIEILPSDTCELDADHRSLTLTNRCRGALNGMILSEKPVTTLRSRGLPDWDHAADVKQNGAGKSRAVAKIRKSDCDQPLRTSGGA